MENRPFQIPVGEAFLVKTPYLDKVSETLYKEEQQRQLQRQKESAALDSEFSKNVSKLRDADIPEYTKKYQDYKNAKINLLKGKFKTNDDFIKAQLDAQRAMADWGSLGAKSIQEKETEDFLAKDIPKDKTGKYDINATKILIARRGLPVTGFKKEIKIPGTNTVVPIDLTDIGSVVKYKLGTTDFSKDFDNSIGQKTPMRIGESQPFDIEGGLQTQKKIYKGFSKTAPEVATSFLQKVVGSQKTDHLLKEHPELNDPNVLASIDSNYDKLINSDLYKEVYKGKPIEFPAWMHDTPQGKVAMYLAKQYAINNPPREELDKPVTKLKAVMDRKWDDWWNKNRITDQQKKENIRLNKEGGGYYEIDNVPLFVRENSYTEPSIYGDFKVMDATKLSEGQMEDIFGKKGGQWGERPYKPIEANGKKLIKILPEGFEVRDANGNPVMIKDKDIIISTHKRTVGEEKPEGLKKMKVRGTAPGQSTGNKKQGEADDL